MLKTPHFAQVGTANGRHQEHNGEAVSRAETSAGAGRSARDILQNTARVTPLDAQRSRNAPAASHMF